jgi:predicted alpha-1,2-mannosidase
MTTMSTTVRVLIPLVLALSTVVPAAASPDHSVDPVAAVDPFIGTGSGGEHVGEVDTFPGATVPFGMVQFSPDTPRRPAGGGYWFDDTDITGFSLTHLSGVGCATSGDFPFLPLTGAVPADPSAARQPFTHSSEHAEPGGYGVTLGGIRTELTATERTGLASLTYPRTDQAQLLVKVANSQAASSGATFHPIGRDTIAGSVTSGHFCGQPNAYTVYFAAKFDRAFTASGTWGGAPGAASVSAHAAVPTPHPGKPGQTPATQRADAGGVVAGGFVTFDTRRDPTVGMRVAISYVNEDGARANLAAEGRSFDLRAERARARLAWDRELRKISIQGGTSAQQRTFYTALYHSLLHPNVFSDTDGRYAGFDGKVHTAPRGHAQYSNFSGWDIYRSQIPLLAMIEPRRAGDMVSSLLRAGDEMGWLPKWPVANGESGVMNGDAADPIIAGAFAFGARDFDTRHAVDEMVRGAEADGPAAQGWYVERPSRVSYLDRGYIPNVAATSISPVNNGASETLEYSLADFAISRLAQGIGRSDVAGRFLGRSQNWANLFDTATGLIRPRDADGAFPPGDPLASGASFGQSGFQEGNAAQYTWMVPQNLAALADGIGGRAAARARLNDYFTALNAGPNEPHHWQGNEPTFGTPWAYNSFGAPWQTQATVRRIMTELYQPIPGGEPGNDDLGAMSSWYVWAAMGLYPQTPGTPLLTVGAPLFDRIHVDAGDDRSVDVTAPGGGTYVQSLRVNGRSSTHTWLMLPDRGTTRLDFTLGAAPNTSWGTGSGDAPPSFGAGPVTFPPTTRAFVSTDPGQIRVAPGGSGSVNLVVDNGFGKASETVEWAATTSTPGITVSPVSGSAAVAAGGKATTALTISASAEVPTGFHRVRAAAHARNGAVIATAQVSVSVARPGERIPTAYVSNFVDNDVTLVDRRTGIAGPTVPVGSGPDGVVVTPDNAEAYVANNNTNNVTVIDTSDSHVLATIPVGQIAADVAVTPDGKTVWVSNFGDGTVQPIDTATHTAGTPIRVGDNPQRLRISPDGTQLWVPNQGSGTISVLELASRTVIRTVPVGAAPFGVAFGAGKAFVGNTGGNSLTVIDMASGAVTGTIPLGTSPAGMANTPDGQRLYVAAALGGVLPVDPATGAVGALIGTGQQAYDVEISRDGTTAWVVNSGSNTVRSLDIATGRLGDPIGVGVVPDGIGLTTE